MHGESVVALVAQIHKGIPRARPGRQDALTVNLSLSFAFASDRSVGAGLQGQVSHDDPHMLQV